MTNMMTDQDVVLAMQEEIRNDQEKRKYAYLKDKKQVCAFQKHLTLLYLTCYRAIEAQKLLSQAQDSIDEILKTKDYLCIENCLDDVGKDLSLAKEKIDLVQTDLRKNPMPHLDKSNSAIDWRVMA